MANEVEITITAKDLTGPAFMSALTKMELMKKAARALNDEFGGMNTISIDHNKVTAALSFIKNKLQSLGIADIADINIQPGRITTQLILLKRLIQQQKISDLLDVNMNVEDITGQLHKIAGITETIPVKFSVPRLALPAGAVENVAVHFTEGDKPHLPIGSGLSSDINIGISKQTEAAIATLLDDTYKLHASLATLPYDISAVLGMLSRFGSLATGAFTDAWTNARAFSGTMRAAIPLWSATGGWWGILTGKLALFGGAFGKLPIIGQIAAWHLLADATAEFIAVLVPAAVGLAIFGAAAIPTVQTIYDKMKAVYTVSKAFNQNIYPMTGAFNNLAQAVQPQVMQMFGDALYVANKDAGVFQKTAGDVANALQNLALRATVALTSQGFGKFLHDAGPDVAKLGDIIGNIFGTVGNLLKVVPGYAQILLTAVDDVTKGLESLSASPIFQDIAHGFLLFHGAAVWLGVAATGIVYLSNQMLKLAAAMKIVSAETVIFNSAQWLTGLGQAAQGFGLMAKEIFTLGAAEDVAAAATVGLEGTFVALGAINPLVWVAGAVVAMTALVRWLQEGSQTAQQFSNAVVASMGPVATQLAKTSGNSSFLANTLRVLSGPIVYFFGKGSDAAKSNADALHRNAVAAQAAKDQQLAMALGVGRNAAAQNALTNSFMTDTLPSLQKVTNAEDALLNVILAGPQSITAFQQAIGSLNTDIRTAGASIGGFNPQSLTFANDLYTVAIPAAQKMSDALTQQGISMGDLKKVVATQSAEMLKFVGTNTEARVALVDYINNALGPGTVKLQTLDKWVAKNGTSLAGMNKIVTKSEIAVSSLAGVIDKQLVSAFQASLFKASGAQRAIDAMTRAIVHGGTSTRAFKTARAQLITDLESTGMSAQDATNFVNGLQKQIDQLHGKNVGVGVVGSGSGTITFAQQIRGQNAQGYLQFHAAGGAVGGVGGSRQDNQMIMASVGEWVIKADAVRRLKRDFGPGIMHMLNGYASGGSITNNLFGISNAPQWMANQESYAATQAESFAANAAYQNAWAAWNAYIASLLLSAVSTGAGAGSGSHGNVGINSMGFDSGGWLRPGWTMAYNGTGQHEQVIPPGRSSGPVQLEVTGGSSAFEQFMAAFIRNFVRVKGGGSVQRAFGSRGKV